MYFYLTDMAGEHVLLKNGLWRPISLVREGPYGHQKECLGFPDRKSSADVAALLSGMGKHCKVAEWEKIVYGDQPIMD